MQQKILEGGYCMLLTESALNEKKRQIEVLKERLKAIRSEKRTSYSQADGDGWHDNFGYEQAMREEQMIVEEIEALSETIRTATFIEEEHHKSKVGVRSRLTLILDYGDGDVEEFVGEFVALKTDSSDNISLNSPIGKAIFGKNEGDTCKCVLPNGEKITITILKIN